jgi:uncharacterized phage-associated protein
LLFLTCARHAATVYSLDLPNIALTKIGFLLGFGSEFVSLFDRSNWGTKMATIHNVADFIILRLTEGRDSLDQLKLQKLLYYVQAWNLAIHDRRMFDGRFQAWIHGPVNRSIYDRFSPQKRLYSRIGSSEISEGFRSEADLSAEDRLHIEEVLTEYAGLTGDQLETMTHQERPWILARQGFEPDQRCEVLIDEDEMRDYYRARIKE